MVVALPLRANYMARCQQALESSDRLIDNESADEQTDVNADFQANTPALECPHCGGSQLKLIAETPKPSWKELFWRENETCPPCYAKLQRADHRRFWSEAYGEDYCDGYLETQVKGAKESEPVAAPPIQSYLPGMTPNVSFEIESF